jgi:dTDP-glucose pyrophosphorylase
MRRIKDIAKNLCAPGDRMATIMARFNTLAHQYVIAVDADDRPVGTITDGDIRRAILAGANIDSSVAEIMNRQPLIGQIDEAETASQILETYEFVPMVDKAGKLREIWRAGTAKSNIGTALIMAGGKGRRLGDITKYQPKPMVKVGDKPILGHILDWLEAGGVPSIRVSTHYLSDQIQSFLEARQGPVQPVIIEEKDSLGTAGALAQLPDPVHGPVLMINGDVLTKLDVGAFEDFHRAHGYDCTIAVSPYEVSVPFGVTKQDETGTFVGIEEKPTYTYFVSAGIYLLESAFYRLVPPNTPMDMPDLINLGRNAGLTVGMFPIHEYWIDVGRPNDLRTAERDHDAQFGAQAAL